jgi:hypothetical protein
MEPYCIVGGFIAGMLSALLGMWIGYRLRDRFGPL